LIKAQFLKHRMRLGQAFFILKQTQADFGWDKRALEKDDLPNAIP
jgi:hypothetical protein